MIIKEIILNLQSFWQSKGCSLLFPYDIEKGAATANPATFLGVVDSKPRNIVYLDACRRPQDGRYGENKNRLYQHHQIQVIMQPAPDNIENLYYESLEALGVDLKKNDIKFLEDDWEQPTLGAWGLGSEVRMNGMEITQFTYFNQVANIDLEVKPVELAYGIERLALQLQDKEDILELLWDKDVKYSEIFKRREYELSKYTFEVASVDNYLKLFEICVNEAKLALEASLPIAAYDMVLKASHFFNILDAKKAISPKERQRYIQETSSLAKACCLIYREDI